MTHLEDFNEGDMVRHSNGHIGVVESVVDGVVCVRFDQDPDPRRHWYGVYDSNWFRIHHGMLSRI